MNLHSELMLFTRKTLIAVGIAAAAWLILAGAIKTFDVLLVVFAGILLGLFMRGAGTTLSRYTHLPMIISMIVVWLIMIAAIILIPWLFGPTLASDFNSLFAQIPKSIERLCQWTGDWGWAQQTLNQVTQSGARLTSTVVRNAMGVFSTLLGGLSSFLLMLALGLYFSVSPRVSTSQA